MTDSANSFSRPPTMNGLNDNDEIDLLALLGSLWDGRWLIIAVTLAFASIGVAYALLQPPIYQANTLIQVEAKQSGPPGMENLSGLLESPSNAETEIQLIKSRRVLGKVVENLNLDIVVTPNYFPVVGETIARHFNGGPGEVAEPLWGTEYAWGGEKVTITRMQVPGRTGSFVLRVTEQGWELLDEGRQLLLTGDIHELASKGRYSLMVTKLVARPGTLFSVSKRSSYVATNELQGSISAGERGRGSGIIALTYEHRNPEMAERVLEEVGENYVRQNVERSSAEAAQSLEFLRSQLPQVRKDLEAAERRLNEYQVTAETIDITAEGSVLLEQIVELETRISELEIQRAEIEQRFQPTHPRYKAWVSQMAELKQRRAELDRRIGTLPATQQELVRLRRDVEVGNEIYLQMLSNIQQLDIARAGTVGNVRVVDKAAVNTTEPVKPKRSLIAVVAFLLGGMVGVGIVLVRSALNRGVENPEDIEKIGLPVYASIPLSKMQSELMKPKSRARLRSKERADGLLSFVNPADLAVESLRSLRTSLHFAMMDAKNNILMISGPSPGVGKSFVSANLAAVIAMGGQKVLLIDGDLRRGFSHDVLRVRNEKGLSDLLAGRASIEEVIIQSGLDGLEFVSRGTIPPNPAELLMSKRFDEFLAGVSSKYDLVIIDTPPILAVTDPAIVGKHAGTTMLVTRFGINPAKEIELTKRRFEQNGVNVKGVVLNAVTKKASAYSYGNYQYEYQAS